MVRNFSIIREEIFGIGDLICLAGEDYPINENVRLCVGMGALMRGGI